MHVTIGATLHSVVQGKLPCHHEGQSPDNCETAQNIGMDCCAECVFEEVFHRQDDRASGHSRVGMGKCHVAGEPAPSRIDCSIDVIGEDAGVDGIVIYDAASRPRLVVENIDGKLTAHVWENADEDIPTTAIVIS